MVTSVIGILHLNSISSSQSIEDLKYFEKNNQISVIMGNEGVDNAGRLVEIKSLLERYDIPIDHLSYEYVIRCKNSKELERIVIILRSGEEGYYPHLTEHAEKQLAKIKPGSSVLRFAEPVLKRNLLEPEKRTELEIDMNDWMCEMNLREKNMADGRAMNINQPILQPAIRKIMFEQPEKPKQSLKSQKNNKRIGACDYAGWDKYDADTELNRIDLQQQQKQAEVKKAQKRLANKDERMKKASKEEIIKQLMLTATELSLMAEKEREKGNEAFRSCDYVEALSFYNASIAIDATINAYNNRAITYIKMQRYEDAVNDCNNVISMDYTNIKALLRRGLALEHLEKRAQALADYEAVLKLEPSNSIAIKALNKLRGPCDSKKIRMKIEDTTILDEISTESKSMPNNKGEKSWGATLKASCERDDIARNGGVVLNSSAYSLESSKNDKGDFQNVTNDRNNSTDLSQMSSAICFCEDAASSSQYSSPQPHFRGLYCPKGSGINLKRLKPQSIATDAKKPYRRSSGVIIKEIPNEPTYEAVRDAKKCNNNKRCPLRDADEKINQRDENSTKFCDGNKVDTFQNIKKSAPVVTPKCKSIKMITEKFLRVDKKESPATDESGEQICDERNIFENHTGKSDTTFPVTSKKKEIVGLSEPNVKKHSRTCCSSNSVTTECKPEWLESPYEFLRLWHSMKNDKDLALHANFLKALPPKNLEIAEIQQI